MPRLETMEIEFFSRTARYILLNLKRSKEIVEELGAELFENKIQKYKSNWLIMYEEWKTPELKKTNVLQTKMTSKTKEVSQYF